MTIFCKKWTVAAIAVLLSFFFQEAFAVTCTRATNVFPGALQSTVTGDIINFQKNSNDCAQVCNNPVTSLFTSTVSGSPNCNATGVCGSNTCGASNCTAKGSAVQTLDAGVFNTPAGGAPSVNSTTTPILGVGGVTDYNVVTVNNSPNNTLGFTANNYGGAITLYKINTLALGTNPTVTFQPGDYWIGSITNPSTTNITFNVAGSGTARIFINGNPTTCTGGFSNSSSTTNLNWNVNGAQSPSKLLIYSYGPFLLTAGTHNISAVIYSACNLNFLHTTLKGAATAGQIITGTQNIFLQDAIITYDASLLNMDFGFICDPTDFLVTAPTTASNCTGFTVSVTPRDEWQNPYPNYLGMITLDTQNGSGTWSGPSPGFTAGSGGTATYQYQPGDLTVNFTLTYPATGASPVTLKAYQSNNATIAGFSNQVAFIPASFMISDPPSPPYAFATKTSGTKFPIVVTAVGPSTCGQITSYTGTKSIKWWTTYVNPNSGTIAATVNGVAIGTSQATGTNQNITFTNGQASIDTTGSNGGNYNDVGQITLNVQDVATPSLTGNSGNFVVKPHHFAINVPSNAASQSNPASTCITNTVFTKAGQAFTANVQAQNAGNTVTPNFGSETPAQGVILKSAALLAPAGGFNGSAGLGTITNGSTFSKITCGGAGCTPFGTNSPYFQGTTFAFDEVGCISLTASMNGGSYLGSGEVPVITSLVVGRFIPLKFSVSGNTPQFQSACNSGGFTYLDQPFNYASGLAPVMTVTAQATSTTTRNYTGSFWKLNSSGFASLYNKLYTPTMTPLLTLNATIPSPTFVDVGGGNPAAAGSGTGTFTFSSGSGLSISRPVSATNPQVPFTTDLQLKITTITDSDSVTCTGTGCVSGGFNFGAATLGNGIAFAGSSGGKNFYHGRIALVDVFGPETATLAMPMQTQYYTSSGWVLNMVDNCTAFGGTGNLTLTKNPVTLSTSASLSASTFAGGSINVNLSAPGANNLGFVDVEALLSSSFANLPWLQYPWPFGGTGNQNPRGRASFGINKGSSQIIYHRETFQ